LWMLDNGMRCDLILISPNTATLLEPSRWQLEVIRGAERLQTESFDSVERAYTEAKRWREIAGPHGNLRSQTA
jgi:hypothetical protein